MWGLSFALMLRLRWIDGIKYVAEGHGAGHSATHYVQLFSQKIWGKSIVVGQGDMQNDGIIK